MVLSRETAGYAKDFRAARGGRRRRFIRKVLGDLTAAGVDCDDAKIREALEHKSVEARRQIIEATN